MITQPLFHGGRTYDAVLFDMDGTLLDSTAVERVWGRWCMRHGLDSAVFIPTVHGVRAIDAITSLALPGVDPHREELAVQTEELEGCRGHKTRARSDRFPEGPATRSLSDRHFRADRACAKAHGGRPYPLRGCHDQRR